MLWRGMAENAAPAQRGLSSRQGLAGPCSHSPKKPRYCSCCPRSSPVHHTTSQFFSFWAFLSSVLCGTPLSKMWKEDKSNHLVQDIFFCTTGRKCHLSKKKKVSFSGNHHLIRKPPIKGGKVFIFRPVCYGVARLQLTFPFAHRCGCCGRDTISETPHVTYSEQFPLHYCTIVLQNQCWLSWPW